MKTMTQSGAFGKHDGKANFDWAGAAGAANSLVGGLFSTLTGKVNTQTATDISLYAIEQDNQRTRHTRNIVVAVVVAAIAAAVAFFVLRKTKK